MLIMQMMNVPYSEDEYYVNGKRMARPAKFQIERMKKLLEDRYGGFLGSVDWRARDAIAAAGVAMGYEKAAKMIESVERSPKVQKAKTEKERTDAVMEKCREMAHETKTTEVREVSQFSWSYYNEELKQDQVTQAKTETVHEETETKDEAGDAERKREGEDENRRQMAMRAGRRESEEEEKLRVALRQEGREQARLVVRLQEKGKAAVRKTQDEAKLRAKLEEAEKVAERNKPEEEKVRQMVSDAAQKKELRARITRVRESEKILELEAKHAAGEAEKRQKIGEILEFAVEKGAVEKTNYKKNDEMALLEIDEKRLAAAQAEVDGRIRTIRKEISDMGGGKKLSAAERMKREKSAKMRALRKKLAFWEKAKGALRRLGGGFFGGMAKMVGGIFK